MERFSKDQGHQLRIKSMTVLLPSFCETKAGLAMGLWLGALYVVIEGWQASNLSDPEIAKLLTSGNVRTLRRFRNWLFHFNQDTWMSGLRTWPNQRAVVEWAVDLDRATGGQPSRLNHWPYHSARDARARSKS